VTDQVDIAGPGEPRSIDLGDGLVLNARDHMPDNATEPPVLAVHGLASNARMWDGVGRRLAAAGHHVVAIDQRGHGRSARPDTGYDMATVADDIARVLDALGWSQAVLVGQSWGGNVVVEAAARHPGRVSAVVAVDGGFINLRRRFASWDDCAAALAPPHLVGIPAHEMQARLEQFASDWPDEGRAGTMANFEVRDDGTIAPWLTFDRHMTVLRGLYDHDPVDAASRVHAPMLMILAGDDDERMGDKRGAVADMADVAAAPVHTVVCDGAHHDVHAQRPDDVVAALRAFLAAVT